MEAFTFIRAQSLARIGRQKVSTSGMVCRAWCTRTERLLAMLVACDLRNTTYKATMSLQGSVALCVRCQDSVAPRIASCCSEYRTPLNNLDHGQPRTEQCLTTVSLPLLPHLYYPTSSDFASCFLGGMILLYVIFGSNNYVPLHVNSVSDAVIKSQHRDQPIAGLRTVVYIRITLPFVYTVLSRAHIRL